MNRKTMKLGALLFFIISTIVYFIYDKYPPAAQRSKDTSVVSVVEVHDGDTISVVINRKKEKVRLIGIDAPELGQRPWGEKAKKYLESLLSLSGWKVTLEFDVEQRDKYGRILAYLRTSNGDMINLLMLKNGYAMLYTFPPNVKYVNELQDAQREARDKRRGIWSEKGLKERPGDYRKEHPRM